MFLGRGRPPPAIVLLRLAAVELVVRVESVVDAIQAALVTDGLFVVIDGQGVRMRSLPRP